MTCPTTTIEDLTSHGLPECIPMKSWEFGTPILPLFAQFLISRRPGNLHLRPRRPFRSPGLATNGQPLRPANHVGTELSRLHCSRRDESPRHQRAHPRPGPIHQWSQQRCRRGGGATIRQRDCASRRKGEIVRSKCSTSPNTSNCIKWGFHPDLDQHRYPHHADPRTLPQ
jgi:hypothetical protein